MKIFHKVVAGDVCKHLISLTKNDIMYTNKWKVIK